MESTRLPSIDLARLISWPGYKCVVSSRFPPCSSPPHKQAVKGLEMGRGWVDGRGVGAKPCSCIPTLRTCWNPPPPPQQWSERLTKPNIYSTWNAPRQGEQGCILATPGLRPWWERWTVNHALSNHREIIGLEKVRNHGERWRIYKLLSEIMEASHELWLRIPVKPFWVMISASVFVSHKTNK